jgi:hypothetical protein
VFVAACGTPQPQFKTLHRTATIAEIAFFDLKHATRSEEQRLSVSM